MVATARFLNLWRIINNKEAVPSETDKPDDYEDYQLRKDQAIALIKLTIEPEQRIHIVTTLEAENPHSMWTALENAHKQKKPAVMGLEV